MIISLRAGLLICCFSISVLTAQSQDNQSIQSINEDVWAHFYTAFETNDSESMAMIHSRDLVRVTGNNNRIRDYESAIESYKNSFSNATENAVSNQIELRFFERIIGAERASERGYYKLTRTKDGEQKSYYGQFHVLLKLEDGKWRILMDYDSNPNDSYGEEEFQEAYAIDDFTPFVQD